MPKKTPTELVVDLRGRSFDVLDDFWDAIAGPLVLPQRFGRNPEGAPAHSPPARSDPVRIPYEEPPYVPLRVPKPPHDLR